MRSHLFVLSITLPCAIARADDEAPPSPDDAELLQYVAEAEAKAQAGETIVVEDSAGPVDTPSSGVRVVSQRALELTPHRNADDYLRLVPGLYMSQHGSEGKGQQFFLRGFDAVHGSDVSIRVNGIPINEMSNVHGQGYADLGFIIPETVHGLTSRKGPFDLEQGWFATAGSIDLVLGTANRGRRVGYEVGSTNRHRAYVIDAPTGRPEAEFVAADVLHDTGYGKFRGTEHASVMAQTELTAGRLVLRPMFAGNWTKFGEPGVIALADIASSYFDRMDAPAGDLGGRSQRLLGGLGATWKRGADEVVASAHLGWRGLDLDENFTGYLENTQYGDGRRQVHRAITGGARVAWRHTLSRHVRLLTGTEVLRDQLEQYEDRISTRGAVWRNERSTSAATTSAGTWAGAQVRDGRWLATAGARVDAMMVDAADRLDAM
ncbi:MAG: TonB-dependent receptor plug domain-containing protein, partial [Deltaproteobacteria bacterium]|nr:TonB-dependent receptor plug domain-containing protein [Deltaproteobacteria bacterium]